MILVDTTLWIDFFCGKETAESAALEQALADGDDIAICGTILAEVLQGIREDKDYRRVKAQFEAFTFLPMERESFVQAAQLYRSLRRRGVTVRKPADCMIAAVAIEHGVPLLHNDRDFEPIAKHCGLKVVKTPKEKTRRSSHKS